MNRPRPLPIQPGQESVWDYPRPPRLEPTSKHLQVIFNQEIIADTHQGQRVLETSHPPVYYFPPEDVKLNYLERSPRQTYCEWKGQGAYYHIRVGSQKISDAAWFYPHPTPRFQAIQGYIAFYPSLMDACYVEGCLVTPQPGNFYGGWITPEIVGPFKGEPGSWGW